MLVQDRASGLHEANIMPYRSSPIMRTAAFPGWISLVSKFDPTGPLSPRNAQKLLTSVTSSFRNHLDDEHPPIDKRISGRTNIHLSTILSGRHFNGRSYDRPVCHTPDVVSVHPATEDNCFTWLQQSAIPPMTHFKNCVSAGIANLSVAAACLEMEYNNASQSSDGIHKSLKSSGAGTILLNWLYSSSYEEGLKFLGYNKFRNHLSMFIIAEGKEHWIWEWLQELNTYIIIQCRPTNVQLTIRKIQEDLLRRRFTYELRTRRNLGFAIEIFSQRVQDISLLAGISVIDNLIFWFIRLLTSHRGLQYSGIELLIRIIDEWDVDPRYRLALVNLYRPQPRDDSLLSSNPMPGHDLACLAPALTLLRQYPTENIFTDSERRRLDLIFLSFRLVELLSQDGSDPAMRSATWVMRFLQAHFAAEIDAQPAPRPNADEKHNLQLLDILSGA